MGDWSEYFEDYPGGYCGEAPYTLPAAQAEHRRREMAAQKQADYTAEIQALIAAHTLPKIGAIREALAGAGDGRPETSESFGRWVNERFHKDLSTMALSRLIAQLEQDSFLAVDRDGGRIQYLSGS